jgi:hypothetical protein
VVLKAKTALTTVGGKLVSVLNAAAEKASIDKDGIISGYPVFGELYDYETATGLTLTDASTYYQVTDTVAGSAQGLVASAATDDISLPNEARFAGYYSAAATVSFTLDANGQVIEFKLYKEGVGQDNCAVSRYIATGADQGAVSINCIVSAIAADSFDLRVANTTSAGDTISIQHLNINLRRLN